MGFAMSGCFQHAECLFVRLILPTASVGIVPELIRAYIIMKKVILLEGH